MSPYQSDDLTETVEKQEGRFLVYRSPCNAEHYPNYERVAIFPTLAKAETYLGLRRRNDDQSARLPSRE
jgi:hypothetical protein